MKLTIEKLQYVSSYWYSKDSNGYIGKMFLRDSYLPKYILEDETLYYELVDYMYELEQKYNSYLSGKHKKEVKKSGLSYKEWIKSVYKSFFKYYGNHNLYDCNPSNEDKKYIQETEKNILFNPILIDEIPKKFHDIIPKYKLEFENTEIIEDVSKFSFPDSYAKKKYHILS